MNELTETMTSLEMAELLDIRHDNVRRGIQRLAEELEWEIISEEALSDTPCGGATLVEKQIVMPNSGQQAL